MSCLGAEITDFGLTKVFRMKHPDNFFRVAHKNNKKNSIMYCFGNLRQLERKFLMFLQLHVSDEVIFKVVYSRG